MSNGRASTNVTKGAASVLFDQRILPRRFLVASNRLPYQLDLAGDRVKLVRGVGGLVSALDPLLRRCGGTWLGWSGNYDSLPEKVLVGPHAVESKEYQLKPLSLTRKEVEQYYLGYSNKSLWPLFHYFQEHCEFNLDQWKTYQKINRRFADSILREYQDGDLIWIHDYHLLLVPAMLRRELPQARIAFFLHIPFPSTEIYLLEPHAQELLAGLLLAFMLGKSANPSVADSLSL